MYWNSNFSNLCILFCLAIAAELFIASHGSLRVTAGVCSVLWLQFVRNTKRNSEHMDTSPCRVEAWLFLRWSKRWRQRVGWVIASGFAASFYAPALLALAVVWCVAQRCVPTKVLSLLVLSWVAPTMEWPMARQLGQLLYEAFDARHTMTDSLALRQAAEDYTLIFCLHPHGIVPLQTLMFCALCDQLLKRTGSFVVASASVLFYLPVLRTLVGWFGGVPADYETIKRSLHSRHLYVTPGGLAEMMKAKRGADIVVWKKRRGLCRLALETGARLVPIYVFNNDYFDHAPFTSLSRRLRVSILLFWGQCGLPIPFRPRRPLVFAIGQPLETRRIASPTDSDIDRLHANYETALHDLFRTHRAAAGKPDAHLVVT
mmetsp:Transcript_19584/g.61572  ORF Transcript_19584/g.61572 Transcript_19584/m.61572 type:complete len:373 (+) Transcript_19584:118-1236(+)